MKRKLKHIAQRIKEGWRRLLKATAKVFDMGMVLFEPIFLACVIHAITVVAGSAVALAIILSMVVVMAFIYSTKQRGPVATATIIALSMLPIIEEKIERLREWQDNSEERVIEQAQAFEQDILEMNTDEQLYAKGIDSQGRPVRPQYTRFTVKLKKIAGQPTDRVTLRDTGDFHESFEVLWLPKAFLLSATDWKRRQLAEKYGEAIFGLTPQSVGDLTDMLRVPVLEDFKKQVL